VTLPKGFREQFDLKIGDYVKASWDGNCLMLFPVDLEVKFRMKVTLSERRKEA